MCPPCAGRAVPGCPGESDCRQRLCRESLTLLVPRRNLQAWLPRSPRPVSGARTVRARCSWLPPAQRPWPGHRGWVPSVERPAHLAAKDDVTSKPGQSADLAHQRDDARAPRDDVGQVAELPVARVIDENEHDPDQSPESPIAALAPS